MADLTKKIEENYLTFISIAAGGVALVALLVWTITVFVKKIRSS